MLTLEAEELKRQCLFSNFAKLYVLRFRKNVTKTRHYFIKNNILTKINRKNALVLTLILVWVSATIRLVLATSTINQIEDQRPEKGSTHLLKTNWLLKEIAGKGETDHVYTIVSLQFLHTRQGIQIMGILITNT